MIDESDIIRRVLQGDRDLFAELVRAHQAPLFQMCLAYLKDPHAAEEAAHESFIKAFRNLGSFRGGSSFRTWLTRIGINHCKDILKKRRRDRTDSLDGLLEDALTTPGSLVQQPEELPSDWKVPPAALALLSRGEREVFEAVAARPEAGYDEIGKQLKLSRDGVKGRLKRAREKIQSYLGRSGVQ
jgi:RNA polymerase sigma-70 factor (ECF subfamily)